MDVARRLKLIAWKLTDDRDIRHALLDVADDFCTLAENESAFPKPLRDEVRELRRAVRDVQPRFASHRTTSVLFDREGLGQKGRDTAQALAQRIAALYRAVESQQM